MPGIVTRPARVDEIPALAQLVTSSEQAAGGTRVLSAEELADEWDGTTTTIDTDTLVAEIDGEVVGVAWVWHRGSERRLDRAYVFGEVAPVARRRGVGGTLLDWGVERASERLTTTDPALDKFIRVDTDVRRDDVRALYESRGLRAVRWFETLLRPIDHGLDRPPPEGVVLREWTADRHDEIRRVRNEAFADHWGSTDADATAWSAHVDGTGMRRDLSVIAVDEGSGNVLGYALCARYPWDDEVTGRAEGWIDHLGVGTASRGRGVAASMIAEAIRRFAADGCSHAALDVDADSPTGASRLYRDLGFERHQSTVTYEIRIP